MKLNITDTFPVDTLVGKKPEEQIQLLVEWINDNIRQIALAINGQLSVKDNLAADIRDVVISSARSEVIVTRIARPVGVFCVWSEDGPLPAISWRQTSEGVEVSLVGVSQPIKRRFVFLG